MTPGGRAGRRHAPPAHSGGRAGRRHAPPAHVRGRTGRRLAPPSHSGGRAGHQRAPPVHSAGRARHGRNVAAPASSAASARPPGNVWALSFDYSANVLVCPLCFEGASNVLLHSLDGDTLSFLVYEPGPTLPARPPGNVFTVEPGSALSVSSLATPTASDIQKHAFRSVLCVASWAFLCTRNLGVLF